jgi:hypothetical protein
MRLLFFLSLLFLTSCSDNLLYSESTPHVSIEVLNRSDTILAGKTVEFKATISHVKNYFWTVNSTKESTALQFSKKFEENGLYIVTFYAVDVLKDTLSNSLSIRVSSKPVCEDLGLKFSGGAPIFEWECYSEDPSDKLSYKFLLRDDKRILLETDDLSEETRIQYGYALPNYWKANLIVSSSYSKSDSFKTELTWSSP